MLSPPLKILDRAGYRVGAIDLKFFYADPKKFLYVVHRALVIPAKAGIQRLAIQRR